MERMFQADPECPTWNIRSSTMDERFDWPRRWRPPRHRVGFGSRCVGSKILSAGNSSRKAFVRVLSVFPPDFELPDLAGRMHTLVEHRGKKVLFIAYASW